MFKYLLVPSTWIGFRTGRWSRWRCGRRIRPRRTSISCMSVDVKQVMVMLAGSGMTFLGRVWSASRRRPRSGQRRAREGLPDVLHRIQTERRRCPRSRNFSARLEHDDRRGTRLPCPAGARGRCDRAWPRRRGRSARSGRAGEGSDGHRPASPDRTLGAAARQAAFSVAIAWKDRPEAARAVTAAMPLIAEAERVVILSVSEDGGDEGSSRRLRHGLQWHNPNVSVERLACDERPAPRILMEAAAGPRVSASLLVMGG